MSLEFKIKDEDIEMTTIGTYGLGNCIRRILLCEIPSYAFDISLATCKSSDFSILKSIFINLTNVKLYSDKCKDFYLSVSNETDEYLRIMSQDIREMQSKKPADVQSDVFIWAIKPHTNLLIENIKLEYGIGSSHAKFCEMRRNVKFYPLDIMPIEFLNERGFIESSPKFVYTSIIKKLVSNKNLSNPKFGFTDKYLLWNNKWADKIKLNDSYKVERKIKVDYEKFIELGGKFLRSEVVSSIDHFLAFKYHDPKWLIKSIIETITMNLNLLLETKSCSKSVLYLVTSYFDNLIYVKHTISIDNDNGTITIDKEDILEDIVDQIKKILANHKII